ncbi:MAG: hypothetical protein Q8Q09_28220 [Deltaproteobacteria bacterium]|nr:hypothetical protein [Deltaproteobacteria bacterium]
MDASNDPLHQARARLEDTLTTLEAQGANHAMLPAARNAIECLGGLARFGATAGDMAHAVARTGEAITRLLDRDPGEALCAPLLEQRAIDLAAVVTQMGPLETLASDDREAWTEAAVETVGLRDAADAWLLGAAALLRYIEPGPARDYFEQSRERTVALVARFDLALMQAMGGLSVLRDTAREALRRARGDRGYPRRAWYWRTLAES